MLPYIEDFIHCGQFLIEFTDFYDGKSVSQLRIYLITTALGL